MKSRSGIDQIASHHALTGGADRDHGVAGHDPGPQLQIIRLLFGSKLAHGGYEIQPGAHCPLGVILVRSGRTPHRHERVADELLDHAAVALHDVPPEVEVASQEVPDRFWIARFRDRGEANQICEEDGDEPSFRNMDRHGRYRL